MKTHSFVTCMLILALALPMSGATAQGMAYRGEGHLSTGGLAETASAAPDGVVRYAAPIAQGSGDCSSWANACTLQTALAGAHSGDEIWVQAGLHTPGMNRTDTFALVAGVEVYGGFAGTETSRDQRNWQTHLTILSGDIDGNDANGDGNFIAETAADIQGSNSYHVVRSSSLDGTAVLDGFVITAGQANGADDDGSGGGMFHDNSSPSLANLTFSGNTATEGGGMYNYQSSPTLTGAVFSGNSAGSGGGMRNYQSSPALTNVIFSGNAATLGGGMDNSYYSSPTLTNVVFRGNTAGYGGGGVYGWRGDPLLTNVTFNGNSAYVGGGIYNDESNPTLANCILWGDTATSMPEIYNNNSTPTVTYSDVQGGYAGAGNINTDPLFVNAANGNLRLELTSPAIDAGNNAAVPVGVTTDLDGNPRFADITDVTDTGLGTPPIVDMGAYEAQEPDNEPPTMPDDPITGSPLITPTLGVTVHTVRPLFDWTDGVDNVGVVSYTLVITAPGALARAAAATVHQIVTTESEYTPTWILPNGDYTWSVRAHDAAGNASPWVEPQSFTVDANLVFLPLVVRH